MVATRGKPNAAAKKAVHYEFGGPVGALGIIFGLPAVCYGLVLFCNANGCIRWGKWAAQWRTQRRTTRRALRLP